MNQSKTPIDGTTTIGINAGHTKCGQKADNVSKGTHIFFKPGNQTFEVLHSHDGQVDSVTIAGIRAFFSQEVADALSQPDIHEVEVIATPDNLHVQAFNAIRKPY